MTVKLSDADYGRMMWALREIACGLYTNGKGERRRLTRDEMRLTAATVCDQFGWTYGLAELQKLEQA